MDAATLRIILLVVGIAFLGALFLWERRRASSTDADPTPKPRSGRNKFFFPVSIPEKLRFSLGSFWTGFRSKTQSSANAKREPNLGLDDVENPQDDDRERVWYDQPDPDPAPDGAETDRPSAAHPYPEDPEDPGDDIDAADLIGTITETEDGPIVQVFVVARDGTLSGRDILATASRHLLIAGKKAIFHRLDGDPEQPRILFSMANLVQPGSFPLHPDPNKAMADFETRGVALFTQVRGEPQDIESLDTMLTTAKSLARELSAEVEDAQHRPITVKRIESMRTCVLSYRSKGERPLGQTPA